MKKIVIIIPFLLSACMQISIPEWPVPSVGSSVETILAWVGENISYKSDVEQYGVTGYWATPLETYMMRAGDCEDFCTLALYLIHRDVGIDGSMVFGTDSEGVHGWIRIDGVDWEPETGRLIEPGLFEEAEVRTYAETMATVGYTARQLIMAED